MRGMKICAAAIAAASLVCVAASPSRADNWGTTAAAAGVGFAAGAAIGSAAANSYPAGSYGPGYAYAPAYGGYYYDEPAYAYAPAPTYGYAAAPAYAYAPAPAYTYAPSRTYVVGEYAGAVGSTGCWVSTDSAKGYGYWGSCADTGKNLSRRGVAGHRTQNYLVR